MSSIHDLLVFLDGLDDFAILKAAAMVLIVLMLSMAVMGSDDGEDE